MSLIQPFRHVVFKRSCFCCAVSAASSVPSKTVCTVSVVHNQIEEPEKVIEILCKELELSEEYVKQRVEKYSSMEIKKILIYFILISARLCLVKCILRFLEA